MSEIVRLNLGCGDKEIQGYWNLDLEMGHDIYPLFSQYRLADNSLAMIPEEGVDEIRASHVLEHFSHTQTRDVLRDWADHLKLGGILRLAVPDFGRIARAYVAGEALPIAAFLMGSHRRDSDYHKALFDEPLLRALMTEVGITDIRSWLSPINDCASLAISLNLMGTKGKETSCRAC